MKKLFQILTVILAIGALAQTIAIAKDRTLDDVAKPMNDGEGNPGV